MKKMMMILAIVGLLLGGCAGKQTYAVSPIQDNYLVKMDLLEQAKLMQANQLLDEEKPEEALWVYEDLLAQDHIDSSNVRTGLLTNAALSCLQQADEEKFLYFVKKLRKESRGLHQLPKNSQFVLVLGDEINGHVGKRDLRINVNLQQTVATVVENK